MEKRTRLQKAINDFEKDRSLTFKPSVDFYKRIDINPKRFWQLVEGKKRLYPEEINSLSKYFNVPDTDFLRQ